MRRTPTPTTLKAMPQDPVTSMIHLLDDRSPKSLRSLLEKPEGLKQELTEGYLSASGPTALLDSQDAQDLATHESNRTASARATWRQISKPERMKVLVELQRAGGSREEFLTQLGASLNE